MQKKEIGPLPYTMYKNECQWIKDLNVRDKTLKLLEQRKSFMTLDLAMTSWILYRQQQENR